MGAEDGLGAIAPLGDGQIPRKEEIRREYIIERDIPAVGSLGRDELEGAAETSNGALGELGPDIRWVESFVAADKIFCVYFAKDEAIIHKHSELSGFPASKVTEFIGMIDPTMAAG